MSGHVEVLARTLYVQKINGYIHVQCLRLVGNVELCRSNTFCTDTGTAIYRYKKSTRKYALFGQPFLVGTRDGMVLLPFAPTSPDNLKKRFDLGQTG